MYQDKFQKKRENLNEGNGLKISKKKKSRFVFIFELEKHGVLRRSRPWSAGQCEEEHVT